MGEASLSRRITVRVALGLIVLGVILGASELVLRALHPADSSAFFPGATRGGDGISQRSGDLPVFTKSTELAQKNVRGIFRGHVHRTNAMGFRGPDYESRPISGSRRILVTGDSVTMGSGVDESDSFPMQAEWILNERDGAVPIEVINAGLAGANIRGALARLQKGIRAYAPHDLVYGYVINDITGPDYVRMKADRTALNVIREAGWPARSDWALIRVPTWEWLDLWGKIARLNMEHFARESRYNYFENDAAWAAFEGGLDRFASLATYTDACAHLFILTRLEALDADAHPFNEIYDRVAQAASARGIHVIETAPDLYGLEATPLRSSPIDPHPNVAGHRLFAELLVRGLDQAPEACRSKRLDSP